MVNKKNNEYLRNRFMADFEEMSKSCQTIDTYDKFVEVLSQLGYLMKTDHK